MTRSHRNKAGTIQSARELVEATLAKIGAAQEGNKACFVGLDPDRAREDASAIDRVSNDCASGKASLFGKIFSAKDLFDVGGETTTAGSIVLKGRPPAAHDAPVLAALRACGMILLGRTNMTEFAYSGLGLNPHYGTPRNAVDPMRIPGGSSSGAAVSVAQGLSKISICSDTSGSARVPAAFNGVVGFRPSCGRYSAQGMVPLSPTQDSVGSIAASVGDCAQVDAILSSDTDKTPGSSRHEPLTLAVPRGMLLELLDAPTARSFEQAVAALSASGMRLRDTSVPSLSMAEEIGLGGIIGFEAWQWHHDRLAAYGNAYDPRVRSRLEAAAQCTEGSYTRAVTQRLAAMRQIDLDLQQFDALICPTTPCIAPKFSEIIDDRAYARLNARVLRNTYPFSMLDLPAISLPAHEPGQLPVGIMIVGQRGMDLQLLKIAETIETVLARNFGRIMAG